MNRLTRLLTGLAVGAVGMYFLDPRQGKRRRALVRDQWVSLKTQTPKKAGKQFRHLGNQAKGLLHEVKGSFSSIDSNTEQHQSQDQPLESQASRMQSMASGDSLGPRQGEFIPVGPAHSNDGSIESAKEFGIGPGEGGQRAPSRQPKPRNPMDL